MADKWQGHQGNRARLCLPLRWVYSSELVTEYRTLLFMAQGAINHIRENITKSLEAAKERGEEQLHNFAFCEEWLSSCFCRSVFAFPRVCLYFWNQQEHTRGKANRLDVFTANWALFQFSLWHLSGQILRGQWNPEFKVLAFLLRFRSVSW